MLCPGNAKHPDVFRPGQPGDFSRRRKQVRRMSRAAIFAAAPAMAQEEAFELSRYAKPYGSTQALSVHLVIHS